jgi:type IV secretion system protein VirD4
VVLVAAGAAVIGVGLGVHLGARLAGAHTTGGLDVWLRVAWRLAGGRTPTDAWGPNATGVPATWWYWTCTAAALAAVVAVAAGVVWGWRRLDPDPSRRRRFGQDVEARQATARDLVPLRIPTLTPPQGRMLLGRLAGTHTVLATEDRERHPLARRAARRQGNRGSVALIGPTGSGKTALAATAIALWDGPVVAVSVKRDLFDTTVAPRATRGEIAVFDPGAATTLPTARWSPLAAVTTSTGALRSGRALAQAIPKAGVNNSDYWSKHGEKLLGAFLAVAGLSRLVPAANGARRRPVSMEQLASWVTAMAGAAEPAINELIRAGLDSRRPLEVQLLARHAAATFTGLAREDHKIRSSVYATAALAVDPWLEPSVAHSASDSARPTYDAADHYPRQPRIIDLDWLVASGSDRANTLYLTASQPEFERLSPVLGGLLADLKDQIHAADIAGRRLAKPLLIVIDEAGQLELGWLPAEVSTIAALGAFFVTCWQSLSQIQHRYGALADAVLSGHRTKCFFAGIDDLATVRYLSVLLGHEHVERWTTSHDVPGLLTAGRNPGRRSLAQTLQREEFAPANTLRQMYPGEAVLLHGTLPPAHLDAVRWWNEHGLARLVSTDADGHPLLPDDLSTCPLSDEPARDVAPPIDQATIDTALAQLPQPARTSDGGHDGSDVDDDPPPKRPVVARPPVPVGRCSCCGRRLAEGQGRLDGAGGVRCTPTCLQRTALNTQGSSRD